VGGGGEAAKRKDTSVAMPGDVAGTLREVARVEGRSQAEIMRRSIAGYARQSAEYQEWIKQASERRR